MFISWSNRLSIGHDRVDGQHQALIGTINHLHDMAGREVDPTRILGVLQKLAKEINDHFYEEEQLMKSISYPAYTSHKEEHTRLMSDISDFISGYEGGDASSLKGSMDFLKNWLLVHIERHDRRLGAFIAERL